MHHVIWDAAAQLWMDGHYRRAVDTAAIFLNAHVQARVSRTDVSGVDLMNQVFSKDPAKEGKLRLRWPGRADDETTKSMSEGLRQLAPGVFKTVRNPAAHLTDELTPQAAGEQLAVLSMLAGWIDACEVEEPPTP
jgi:uncharacterized protein (TIGR02391 family)